MCQEESLSHQQRWVGKETAQIHSWIEGNACQGLQAMGRSCGISGGLDAPY